MFKLSVYAFVVKVLFGSVIYCQHANYLLPIDNGKLSYRIYGEGEPVLIINGGPGMNSNGFEKVALTFAEAGYKGILFDQRGTGSSRLTKIDSTSITMEKMVSDLETLRKHLNLEKWTIFGQSFGGIYATYYASKFPQRVSRLILSASGGMDMDFLNYVSSNTVKHLNHAELDSFNLLSSLIARGDNSERILLKRAKYIAPAYFYDKSKSVQIEKRLIELNRTVNGLVIQNLQDIHYDCKKAFKDSQMPVLVLQGENDIIKMSTAQTIASSFPFSELVFLPKCGHYGWIEATELYYKSIFKFMKRNG